MIKYIRKAIVAGVLAGIAADWGLIQKEGVENAFSRDGLGQLIGTFLVAALAAGTATWAVRNKPQPPASGKTFS